MTAVTANFVLLFPRYLIKVMSLLDMPCALNVKDWLRISICFYIF